MHSANLHLSDQEVLAFADGELGSSRAARVRRHLAACWTCRSRLAKMEETIGLFVQLYHHGLDPKVTSDAGLRALLKARLSVMRRELEGSGWCEQINFVISGKRWAYSAVVVAFLVLSTAAWRQHRTFFRSSMASARATPGVIPDRRLTPGAVRSVMLKDVCSLQHSDKNRPVTPSVRQDVFRQYGMTGAPAADYEVDYLITPELGGSDEVQNLWPEPYSSTVWNAYIKDALEDRLHQLVCERQIDLVTAQHAIATDWIGAYKKYFHTEKPLVEHQGGLAGELQNANDRREESDPHRRVRPGSAAATNHS